MPENTSSASSPGLIDMIYNVVDYKKLQVMDYVRSGALLALFLVLMFRGPASNRANLFALADVLGMGAMGLACYFFPANYLGYNVDGQLDVVHEYLMQILGAMAIGTAWARYRSLETRDAYCSVSFSLVRLLGSAVFLATMLQAQYGLTGPKRMSPQHFSFTIFGTCIWHVGHAIQLYHYSGEGKRAFGSLGGSRRDIHMLIATVMIITATMFHWSFPETTMKTAIAMDKFVVDDIHLHVLRLFSVMTFMAGLQFLAALNYETDADKKNAIEGVLVVMALFFPLVFLYQLKHGLFRHFYVVLAGCCFQAANMLIGYCDGPCCSWCSGFFSSQSKSKKR